MKQDFRVGKKFPGSRSDLPSESLPALVRLLADLQVDESHLSQLLTQLSQGAQLYSFRLGDEIGHFLTPESFSSETSVQEAPVTDADLTDLYLVCQGRVRLLCQSLLSQSITNQSTANQSTANQSTANQSTANQSTSISGTANQNTANQSTANQSTSILGTVVREVTALLLDADEAFGADELLLAEPLPYRAIAASPVQIARIPKTLLKSLFDSYPQLRSHLSQPAQQRERLIFWRRFTALRSLSSQQLQVVLPYLEEVSIAARSDLATATPAEAGHFWLRSGEISSLPASERQPQELSGDRLAIGTSWGYPQTTPKDWIAQTPLRLYHLPRSIWETLTELIPKLPELLENAEAAPLNPVAQKPSATAVAVRPDAQRQRSRVVHLKPEVSEALPEAQPEAIDFPKPLRRHLMDWFERFPWVEQQSSSDCGAACLSMICQYWGKKIPIYMLREQANVNREGASLKSLARAAENLGFHARPVRASLGRMAEIANPWIAHWEGAHYVVVYRTRGNQVIIADPAEGRRSISRKKFQQYWTGYALLLDPTDRLEAIEGKQASLSRYLSALLPYRNVAFQVILLSVLMQIFGLVTPLFTQIILDKIVIERSLPTLNIFALGLLMFGIWSIATNAIRQYLLSYLSNRLDLTLISGFIRHTLKLPLKFFQTRRVGDIITRVQENEKIQRFLVQKVVVAWLDFLTGFVYLGLMFYYNWQLTLLVVSLIPPIILFTLAATPLLRQVSREIFKEVADQNSVLVEMMTGVATVKAAAAEGEMRWRWEDHLTGQTNAIFKGQKLGIRLQAIGGLISTIGTTALLWYGATLVIGGQLTVGQLVAFNMMLGLVISPVVSLANLWDELQEVLISVERLNDVFAAKPEESAQKPLLVLPALRGNILFDHVSFRYDMDEETNILQNVTFEAHPGEMIAIVGRSGSGKSTLVNLIQGLYHPTKGRVIIDGHDIRHVSMPSLRSQFGVSPQESFLFSGTILENITLFRSGYTLEDVIDVAKLAEAHVFIQALPLGYNTKVGERGSSLSGGQRQRIAIARALLGQPRVLILDEATSSLDSESERRFQRNLLQIRRDRTTFIIAHRFSTVRNADRILVIDQGSLVEQGSHDQLMNQGGLYSHLAQQQLEL